MSEKSFELVTQPTAAGAVQRDLPITRVRFDQQLLLNGLATQSLNVATSKCSLIRTKDGIRVYFLETGFDLEIPFSRCLEIERQVWKPKKEDK
jgi:hypothetical protein